MIGSRVRSIRSKGFLVAISVSIAIVLGCMILLVLLPGSGRDKALKAIVEGILIGGIYAVIVLGVVVVYKATKVCNLAHGGVLTFLAYFLWWLLDRAGLPLIVAAIIVVLASLLFGLLINFLFMRRTIGQSGTITFMMTLILGFSVIYGFVILIFGGDPHIMPHIFPSGSLTVGLSHGYCHVLDLRVLFPIYQHGVGNEMRLRRQSHKPKPRRKREEDICFVLGNWLSVSRRRRRSLGCTICRGQRYRRICHYEGLAYSASRRDGVATWCLSWRDHCRLDRILVCRICRTICERV